MRWVWLSLRPGITARPLRSITEVFASRRAMISRSVPTAANNPLSIATAVADVLAESGVVMRPLKRMVSIDFLLCGVQSLTACQLVLISFRDSRLPQGG